MNCNVGSHQNPTMLQPGFQTSSSRIHRNRHTVWYNSPNGLRYHLSRIIHFCSYHFWPVFHYFAFRLLSSFLSNFPSPGNFLESFSLDFILSLFTCLLFSFFCPLSLLLKVHSGHSAFIYQLWQLLAKWSWVNYWIFLCINFPIHMMKKLKGDP